MSQIIGSIITDCADNNARARQQLRFNKLFGVVPIFHGVGRVAPDVEAAGNLIDQLDALMNVPVSAKSHKSVVLVNVAPRGDKVRKKWDNGVPFCYFWIDKTLVVSTYSEQVLNMVARNGFTDSVELMDVPRVTAAAVEWGELTQSQAERINHTQFRSLEFLPMAAYWVLNGRSVPAVTTPIELPGDSQGKVWCIDNFGNAKTTLAKDDIQFKQGKSVTLADGTEVACWNRLADVPKGESALVVGSSGYGDNRFLEVVVQWLDDGHNGSDSAEKRHGFQVGSNVLA